MEEEGDEEELCLGYVFTVWLFEFCFCILFGPFLNVNCYLSIWSVLKLVTAKKGEITMCSWNEAGNPNIVTHQNAVLMVVLCDDSYTPPFSKVWSICHCVMMKKCTNLETQIGLRYIDQ
jgi:hypothetical protein